MDKQTQLSEFLYLMGDLQRAVHQGFSQTISRYPKYHFHILQRLYVSIKKYGQDGAIYVSDLICNWHLAPSAISRSLRTLEQNGYIERTPDSEDHRKTLVRLTKKGETVRKECIKKVDTYIEGIFAQMGEKNVSNLAIDLRLAAKAIHEENKAMERRQKANVKGKRGTSC